MPAPNKQQILPIAKAALQEKSLRGKNAPDLADALADGTAKALQQLASMAMVLPGIPTAVDPITGSGSTAGPGMLMPPPAGGPIAPALEPVNQADLQQKSLRGKNAPDLGKVIAGTLGQAISLFCSMSKVAPGMIVAGFTTTAPGILMATGPNAAQLEPVVKCLMQQNKLRGKNAPDLAAAIAKVICQSLTLFANQMKVAPGIACPPGSSGSPGRLM